MNRLSIAAIALSMSLAVDALQQNAAAQAKSASPAKSAAPPKTSSPSVNGKPESARGKPGKSAAALRSEQKIRDLEKRVERLEKELAKYAGKSTNVPADPKKRKILTLLESSYFGTSYYSSNGRKFLVGRLLVINLTTKAITVQSKDIRLKVDGKTFQQTAVTTQMGYQSFSVGSQSYRLSTIKPTHQLRVPAGGTASTWILFPTLPNGQSVPKLLLEMNLAGTKKTFDVNAYSLRQLGLKVERIGPRNSLGLLTVSGTVNTINAGALADAIDELSRKKVVRVVIRWTTDAGSVDSNLRNWLTQSANNAGRGVTSDRRFPPIPAAIRELHLARMPNATTSSSRSRFSPFSSGGYSPSASSLSRVHASDVDAVIVALKSAYEALPLDELLREIEHGHPLTRAAALSAGGGRLPSQKLPLILKYTDDKDSKMQQAALIALMHFGEKEAVDKLVHFVKKNTPLLSKFAVASLAASRYSNAHAALIAILKNEPSKSRVEIVRILAAYPRPIWSETIYSFVKDENATVRIEALKALGVIGHPQLLDVLHRALKGKELAMRAEAFKLIVQRTDARSEKIAMTYALEFLKKSPPSSYIYTLLRRTKDKRAVPLLLSHLERSSGSRSAIIGLLAVIGDQTVGKRLVKLYPTMRSDYERASILRALIQLKSPDFRKLAGLALLTRDSTLISAASEGLKSEGTKESVKLLTNAFEKSTYTTTWAYISRALAALGTPHARAALRRGRESTNATKRSYSISALNSLLQRSPGYQYIYQARSSVRTKKYKQAIQYYTLALKLDGQLSPAYSGRGHVHLRQMKVKEAKADFAAAIKLDPYDSLAIAGLGITLVLEGNYRDGISQIENNRSKFTSNALFAYNSACVYGRAYEHLLKNKKVADRKTNLIKYRDMAISELKKCVKLGYTNYAEMKIDPDLASLKNLKQFRQIHSPNTVKKSAPKKKPGPSGGPPRVNTVKPSGTAEPPTKKG